MISKADLLSHAAYHVPIRERILESKGDSKIGLPELSLLDHESTSNPIYTCRRGTLGRDRTCDLELRSLLLYPTELRGLGAGWGSRNPISSLENLHINRYTNPACNRGNYTM